MGQQGTLAYVWAERGSRPRAPKDLRYEWAYIFGAVCAERGVGAALVLPHANADAMTLHLAEISRTVAPGAHAVLVLDGAGWHQTGGRLRVPSNITLLHLLCPGGGRDRSFQNGFAALLDQVAREKGVDPGRASLGCDRADVEVWFGDEARVGQKNKITRRWALIGTRPAAPKDQRTVSTYIFGAICPRHHAQAEGAIDLFKTASLPCWTRSRVRRASIPPT